MKTLTAYLSETGNTKKLAEEIFNTLNGEKELCEISKVNSVKGYDIVFVGFPINGFEPVEGARNFLAQLPQKQNIVLFATHAVATDSTIGIKQVKNFEKYTEHLNVLGQFTCMGELSEAMAEVLLKSDNPEYQYFGKLRPETIGHPNQDEIDALKKFVKETIKCCD